MLYSDTVKSEPRIAVSGNGDLHVLWLGGYSGESRIYYSHRPAGGAWQVPVVVAAGSSDFNYLSWAVSDAGHIHVVWRSNNGRDDTLNHVWQDESGTWSTPQIIDGPTTIWPVRLVGDQNGNAHLVWQLLDTSNAGFYYARTGENGGWTSPIRLGGDVELTVDDLAVGADGRVHLLWRYSGDDILYSYRKADGSWSERELVWPGGYNWYHRLLVTDEGQVHIVWANVSTSTLYHRQRSAGGRWSPTKILDDDSELVDNNIVAAVDAQGTVHIVWPKGTIDSCSGLFYAGVDRAGKGIGPVPVSLGGRCADRIWLGAGGNSLVAVTLERFANNSLCRVALAPDSVGGAQCLDNVFLEGDEPAIVIDDGILHAVWSAFEFGMHYAESAAVTNPGSALLSQAVAVPAAGPNPTLSFLYQLDGAREEGGYLEVGVSDAISATSVYSTSTATIGWAHEWLDLSVWSGQSVTLTFKVHEVAGAPRTSALIDEVTVAPAYPDSWVTLAAPFTAPAGEEVTLVVDYGNRGGVDLAGGSLALSLPPEITFVEAVPAPSTGSQWDLGTVPAGGSGQIVITGTVAAEVPLSKFLSIAVTLTGETPELELYNNAAEATIRVGHITFFPAVAGRPN